MKHMANGGNSKPLNGDDMVLWAYRLLLGREPEHNAIENSPFKNDRQRLLKAFLESPEFHAKFRTQQLGAPQSPFATWDRETTAFIHLPKTGGTTLSNLLKACFPEDRVCPQNFNGLHQYSSAELSRYDFSRAISTSSRSGSFQDGVYAEYLSSATRSND